MDKWKRCITNDMKSISWANFLNRWLGSNKIKYLAISAKFSLSITIYFILKFIKSPTN